jgi:3-hydroxyisobutyrate dehydrogenase
MVRRSTAPLPEDDGLRSIFEHTRALGEKDLSLAVAMGEELGVDTPVARQALQHIADAVGVPHEEGST